MKRPYIVFTVLLAAGFLLATLAYRSLQTVAPPRDLAHIELTEAQKKLLDSRDTMSKWLLGLAYTALAGLLGLRFKEQNQLPLDTTLPMAACGLLILSLYGAFLFQDSMMFALSKGPVYHIYGSLMDLPLQLQFWTLVISLVLLALWLFRPPKKYTVTLSLMLAFAFSGRASGQEPVEPKCIAAWQKGREMKFTQTGQRAAINVLDRLSQRAGLKSPVSCDYALSLLDELRWDAYVVKQDDSIAAMEAYLETIDQELRKPGLSMGEVVTKLVSISQVWRGTSGLLIVEARTTGIPILLDGAEAGMTNWERRLAPGIHSVEVVRGGRTIYSNKNVRIEDGKEWRINIDSSK
jgi:hypothetical protein